ncbi:DUF2262 domain-containing protein [Corynebacterium minutissimum]|uniref:Uncharacterized protein conserved in bacteria n=2 Tax=Corynebacterium minutissimum TaxID=38301 RepID=A0A376D2B5_9CORY|nr:DUF2262 domain-containing protein [Corynebacterium minutissimum]STC80754.1 Uncharacterized protein conserved in bacteria [Corynebacterium minutissimum]
MLSLYRDFPEDEILQTTLNNEATEFLFIASTVPQRSESESPYSEDRTHIQLMSMRGLALRFLPDGELITGDIDVRYPQLFQTSGGKTIWDPRELAALEPFTVYRARGARHFHERSQQHYVDIWEILPAIDDPAMDALVAKLAAPVVLNSDHGPLVLDRAMGMFDGRAEDLGVDISIVYEEEELLFAESKKKFRSQLKVINKVVSADFLDTARCFAAKKALPAANSWRTEVAQAEDADTPVSELSVEDIYAALTPVAVVVPQRGHIIVEFDDGYLFGGHPVTVTTKRNGTPAGCELDA